MTVSDSEAPRRVVVAMAGASGSIYGLRLISRLTQAGFDTHFVLTHGAARVFAEELDAQVDPMQPGADALEAAGASLDAAHFHPHSITDVAAPFSSGSFLHRGMVIAPCSMATIGRLAHGYSSNLLERAADVCLKERRRLVLVPRETPLHAIHLENLLTLARAGATILPAMPGFYHRPQSVLDLVDGVVARILDQLGIHLGGTRRWKSSDDDAESPEADASR